MSSVPRVDAFTAIELGNTSYLVSDPDSGEAVTVDPFRDIALYLDRADELGVRVSASLETHVHNDFASGSRELAAEADASIVAAHDSDLEFDFVPARDGWSRQVGRFTLRARHTPGHTPQHLSYTLHDESGAILALFSGGALMVGAIARTDLFGPHLATHLAFQAFRTIHVRLRDLPDAAALYPTHGGGSFCGASQGSKRTSTIGDERRDNPYLLTTELMPFIARALHQGPYPAYYRGMSALNRTGLPLAGRHPAGVRKLDAAAVRGLRAAGAAVVDMRRARAYDAGHIPGSYCIGLDGPFSAWVGWVVDRGRQIVLIDDGHGVQAAQAQLQLLRIGYDAVAGYLDGGLDAWTSAGGELTSFETAEVEDLASWILSAEPMTLIDARHEDEWVEGHVPGAVHMPVSEIEHHAHDLPAEAPIAVYCGGGYRAGIAAGLLEQAGFGRIIHVAAPYSDWDRLHLAATIPGGG